MNYKDIQIIAGQSSPYKAKVVRFTPAPRKLVVHDVANHRTGAVSNPQPVPSLATVTLTLSRPLSPAIPTHLTLKNESGKTYEAYSSSYHFPDPLELTLTVALKEDFFS